MKGYAAPVLLAAAIVSGACGGGTSSPQTPNTPAPTPGAETVAVTFTYRASTEVDPSVNYESCSPGGVEFTTHLHFTWVSWDDRHYMPAVGSDLFEYTADVPVDRELWTALHDPNVCLEGDVYVAPTRLYANGVLLTRVVTVRDGTGVAFRVGADGIVTP